MTPVASKVASDSGQSPHTDLRKAVESEQLLDL